MCVKFQILITISLKIFIAVIANGQFNIYVIFDFFFTQNEDKLSDIDSMKYRSFFNIP